MFLTKTLSIFFVFLTTFFTIGCQGSVTIESSDPNLAVFKDKVYYKLKPFNGLIRTTFPALDEIQITEFKDGLEDGEYISRNEGGHVLERRTFKEGVKVGVHRAWYRNGNNRFYAEFSSGKYINDHWEWYDNGKPSLYEKFDENGKLIVVKKWNRNGQIYMNTVIASDGSSVGLPGSKICEPIKKAD